MKQYAKAKSLLEKSSTYKDFQKKILSFTPLHRQHLGLLLINLIQLNKPSFENYLHLLLEFGADPNFFQMKSKPEITVRSLLMIACQISNRKNVMSLLALKEINGKQVDSQNENILFYALKNKDQDEGYLIARTIIQQYPQLVYGQNIHGKGLVLMAVERKSPKILELILRNDGDPNLQLKDSGNTALHEILDDEKTLNKTEIVQLLLRYGAKPRLKNLKGEDCYSIGQKYEFCLEEYQGKLEDMRFEEKDLQSEYYSVNAATKDEDIFSRNTDDFFKELQFSSDEEDEPIQTPMNPQKLGAEIQKYMLFCEKEIYKAWQDIKPLYEELQQIGKKLNLKIDIIGSYATGLWTPDSDIDVVYVNNGENIHINQILQKIYSILEQKKNKHQIEKLYLNSEIKFPNVTLILNRKLNKRKLDITVFQYKNNGEKYVQFIRNQLQANPFIRPLFYTIKRILKNFKLNNPSRGGVKTYGLFLMLLIASQQMPANNLGQAFIYFVYYFAYRFYYEEFLDGNGDYCLKLNLMDPINHTNNVGGKNTDTQTLHTMFKTLDYGLRLKAEECEEEILPYLFQLGKMFG